MNLKDIFKYILFSFLGLCLSVGQVSISYYFDNVDDHLSAYSHFNESEHDNIDDTVHHHTHKHSEDGEEHEHSHEHKTVTQYEVKLNFVSHLLNADVNNYQSKLGKIVKTLISNPHPAGVFRPPIIS